MEVFSASTGRRGPLDEAIEGRRQAFQGRLDFREAPVRLLPLVNQGRAQGDAIGDEAEQDQEAVILIGHACGFRFDLLKSALEQRHDQGLSVGEIAKQGDPRHARALGDQIKRRVQAHLDEGGFGGVQELGAVLLGVRPVSGHAVVGWDQSAAVKPASRRGGRLDGGHRRFRFQSPRRALA